MVAIFITTKICISKELIGKVNLLAYLIDPYNYKASNGEILDKIIKSIVDFDDLCNKTLSLGGRWAIIYKDEKDFNILTDPSGLRQVCYSLEEKIVGSNPAIINS